MRFLVFFAALLLFVVVRLAALFALLAVPVGVVLLSLDLLFGESSLSLETWAGATGLCACFVFVMSRVLKE